MLLSRFQVQFMNHQFVSIRILHDRHVTVGDLNVFQAIFASFARKVARSLW
jgi:hypothetical protein